MKYLLFFFLICCGLYAAAPPPIEEVREQVEDAETLFNQAKQMFNPWYSGPLLTGSASMMPPGYANWQPYFFATDNYAVYNSSRVSEDQPDLLVLNFTSILQWGVTSWMDMVLTVQGFYQQQREADAWNFGDLPFGIGLKISSEGPYVPKVKIYITETFPTGKWDESNVNDNSLDLTGAGSYVTTLSLNLAKVVWWLFEHPISLRFTTAYDLYPAKVSVNGINAYGGAPNTKGTVTPGRNLKLSFGSEYSFTQRWVFAFDVAYVYSNRSTFEGFSGTYADGSLASVGRKSSDAISVAPAIEYNWSPNLGGLIGAWVSVYGRNTSQFVSAIATIQWTFP